MHRDTGITAANVGSIVGSFVGGPLGGIAGGLVGTAVDIGIDAAWSGEPLGSSSPIGGFKQDTNRNGFPATAGVAASNLGISVSQFNTAMKRYGFVPSRAGVWGQVGEGVKVFGSNGLAVTLRKRRRLKSFMYLYKGRVTQNDWESIGLVADGFLTASGGVLSAGGFPTSDGLGDSFYYNMLAQTVYGAKLSPSDSRAKALKATCQACGFRNIVSEPGRKAIHHRSARNVAISLQSGNTSNLKTASENIKKTYTENGLNEKSVAGLTALFVLQTGFATHLAAIAVGFIIALFISGPVWTVLPSSWKTPIEKFIDKNIRGGLGLSTAEKKNLMDRMFAAIRGRGGIVDAGVFIEAAYDLNNSFIETFNIARTWTSGYNKLRLTVESGRITADFKR